jgi:radical SAM protein with 4Fe4S-binding SPASM domain
MPRVPVYSIAFELTTRCNLHCTHCYNAARGNQQQTTRHHADLLLQRIDRILEAAELQHATLTGGEPLMHPGLFDAIARLTNAGVGCQIISNGLLLDAALALRLKQAGLRGIQLSLHGPDAASHEDYTATPGSFDQTISAVASALRSGLHVTGCIVVTRRNAHQVGQTLALWKSLGVGRVALSRFSPAGLASRHVARLLPSLPHVMAAFDQALPFAKDGMKLFCTMPVPPCAMETKSYEPIRFGCCAVGTIKQEFALGPDGELRNCTLHQKPIGGVSDILEEGVGVAGLFTHADVTRYRERVPTFCKGCLHAKTCAGGCGAAALSVHGSRDIPDPFLWQHLDDAFEARLELESDGESRHHTVTREHGGSK